MDNKKKEWLSEEWDGWRYGWIKVYDSWEEDYVLQVHEFYQINGSVSWTANPTPPDSCGIDNNKWMAKALRELARNLDNKVFFTEEELNEYNKSLSEKGDTSGTV